MTKCTHAPHNRRSVQTMSCAHNALFVFYRAAVLLLIRRFPPTQNHVAKVLPTGILNTMPWYYPIDGYCTNPVSYTHLRAHETPEHLVCRLLLEKKKKKIYNIIIKKIIIKYNKQ
eukprot:TRINITY_DN2247_c0_g1_i1.p1 TRINITY_DN2247_c0_g1~~TRINITY_DN2247_c0_g1_i1.p1  ORF type:complete len:115 (-),score=10.60 TRINITY_DN2247_c0_g1_i1:62-406(-)